MAEPRVVRGFQARKRVRRISEPLYMVVGWYLASNDYWKYGIEALRAAANRCEQDRKACRYAGRLRTIRQVFRSDWLPISGLNLVCFSGPVQFPGGIEPASVATTNNTPIYTHSWARRSAIRRMTSTFTAKCAVNNLRMRRLQAIISA